MNVYFKCFQIILVNETNNGHRRNGLCVGIKFSQTKSRENNLKKYLLHAAKILNRS